MKIGILTFHRALNYGAVLQCYALYTVLHELGHNVEIIDYRPESIERYRNFYSKFSMAQQIGIVKKIKYLIVSLLLYIGRRKSVKRFDAFLSKYLRTSTAFGSPLNNVEGYDVIVFGSDQIWSPSICFGYDHMYWGQFDHPNTKLITYAASIGGHNELKENDKKIIGKYIKSYDVISVREQQLQQLLMEITGWEYPIVVDPTILADSKIFDNIAVKPREENYVLLFQLEPDENAYLFAKRLADNESLTILTLRAIPSYKTENKDSVNKEAVSVDEFLGYFKYAKYIVSISFHGTVFSTIFKKDFYSLKCSQGDRAFNYLKQVGLEKRMVDPNEKINVTKVDYTGFDEKLLTLRQSSMNYLKNALNMNNF